jgi:hypothetical protein
LIAVLFVWIPTHTKRPRTHENHRNRQCCIILSNTVGISWLTFETIGFAVMAQFSILELQTDATNYTRQHKIYSIVRSVVPQTASTFQLSIIVQLPRVRCGSCIRSRSNNNLGPTVHLTPPRDTGSGKEAITYAKVR